MKNKLLKIFCISIIVFAIHPIIGSSTSTDNTQENVDKIIKLTNQDRIKNGKEILEVDEKLTLSAEMKATDMFTKDYFEHISPEEIDPWYWMELAGYSFYYAGENLAKGYDNIEIMQEGFMNSPAHKENVLNDNFEEIGVAIFNQYVVVHFGTEQ